MKKSFETSKKEQCFGQVDCGCIPCCPPCPPQCPQSCCPIVYKTVIQAGEPTPTPTIPSAYAYVYNDGRQTVAASAPILFSSNGVLSDGMTHPVNGNAVTIENAGTYAVWFTMMGTADAQFALFLNDTSVAGTIFGTSPGAAGSRRPFHHGRLCHCRSAREQYACPRQFYGRNRYPCHGSRRGGAERQRFYDGDTHRVSLNCCRKSFRQRSSVSKKDGASEKRSACLFMPLSLFFPFNGFV